MLANKDKALLSKQLVTLKDDVPVKNDPNEFLIKDIDKDKLTALGDVRPPVIADLFMAIMETSKKGGQQ